MSTKSRSTLVDPNYVVNSSGGHGVRGLGEAVDSPSRSEAVQRCPSASTALPDELLTGSVTNSSDVSCLLNTLAVGSTEDVRTKHQKERRPSCGTKGSPASASPAGSGTASSTDSGVELGNNGGRGICTSRSLRRPSTIHSLRRANSDFVRPSGFSTTTNSIIPAGSVSSSNNPKVSRAIEPAAATYPYGGGDFDSCLFFALFLDKYQE